MRIKFYTANLCLGAKSQVMKGMVDKMKVVIRENIEKYMQDLKKWLEENKDADLEEMDKFFSDRIRAYEEHMSIWKSAYQKFAELIPPKCEMLLDLGCGTGLELDEVWAKNPDISVLGVDLCQDMLDKLVEKHSDKKLETVCADYFQYEFGKERWDAVISFESLHHFMPQEKKKLYKKIFECLKSDGKFILGDYIACCDEEEELLQKVYFEKRKKYAVPEGVFVHFDIPLTLQHEVELLKKAGFHNIEHVESIDGATILVLKK